MDRLEAVERLVKLRDTGVLTESEFLQQKSLVMSASSIAPIPMAVDYSANRLRRVDFDDAPSHRPARDPSPQIHIHNTNHQHAPTPVYYAQPDKSIIVSYLLWLFLGGAGGHRFYLGRPGSAVVILMLSLIGGATAALGIGLIFIGIAAIWLFIDLFLIPGMARRSGRIIVG